MLNQARRFKHHVPNITIADDAASRQQFDADDDLNQESDDVAETTRRTLILSTPATTTPSTTTALTLSMINTTRALGPLSSTTNLHTASTSIHTTRKHQADCTPAAAVATLPTNLCRTYHRTAPCSNSNVLHESISGDQQDSNSEPESSAYDANNDDNDGA